MKKLFRGYWKFPWRLHLSTGVILMFFASGLIWLNMPPSIQHVEAEFNSSLLPLDKRNTLPIYSQGWPATIRKHHYLIKLRGRDSKVSVEELNVHDDVPYGGAWIFNLLICGSILFCAWVFLEY